jgi:TIR domain
MKGKIFVSYRRATNAFAVQTVFERLVSAFGEDRVFLDRRSLEPGEDWLQSLDREVARATAVVMVFSQEWFGTQPDGTRRIDDPGDMVRRELVAANRFGRPIIPVIVDGSSPLYGSQLPKGMEFIGKHQFLTLDPKSDGFEGQLAQLSKSIGRAQPGAAWGRRFCWQVTWMALGITAMVAAWHALGGSSTYSNSFARNAMALRSSLGLAALAPDTLIAAAAATELNPPASGAAPAQRAATSRPPRAHDTALIELDDLDRNTLLGGGERFDSALLALIAQTLHQASVSSGSCGPDRPVAVNFDISPDPVRADPVATTALTQALAGLARCRPVVLACPRSVVLKMNPADDMLWMRQLQQAAAGALHFTQAPVDPRGLRHSRLRTEPGIVLADLARGLAPMRVQGAGEQKNPSCACPASPEELEVCRQPAATDSEGWDPWELAVPLDQEARPLSHSLTDIKNVAAKRFVILGASYGGQAKIAVPGRNKGYADNVGDTHMQSYLLHGALEHAPVRGGPLMVWAAMAISWLLAAAILAIGAWLDRNDGRFTRRVPAYLLAGAIMFAVPAVCLLAAGRWPGWTWLLGLVALLGTLTIGRSLLACFEVLLHGGIAWKSLREQVQDVRFDIDTQSALLRLAGATFGRLFTFACLVVALIA